MFVTKIIGTAMGEICIFPAQCPGSALAWDHLFGGRVTETFLEAFNIVPITPRPVSTSVEKGLMEIVELSNTQ